MQSESKWKRELEGKYKNYHSNEKYQKDKTVGNLDGDNPMKDILLYSAIGLSGVYAYRKGALKNLAKTIFEKADDYRVNSLDISTRLKSFKKWTEFDKTQYNVQNSFFRNGIKSFKGLDFKKINNREFIQEQISKVANDTKKDLNSLKNTINKNVDRSVKNRNLHNRNYYDSKIINELDIIENIYQQNLDAGMETIAAKSDRRIRRVNVAEKMRLTKEKRDAQIKKSGYRSATLGDLVDYMEQSDGSKIMYMKRHDISLDEKTAKKVDKFIRETKTAFTNEKQNFTVYKEMVNTGAYKDIILDDNIMISEDGNRVIDLRFIKENKRNFVHSLANDYQIPLLNFNPLRFFGMDKYDVDDTMNAIIHLDTIQPILTGVGKNGRMTINDFNKISEEFGNNPLQFMDGNLYKVDNDGKRTIIATDLKATYLNRKIDSSYGIRSDLNTFRKMAGINTQEFNLYTEEDGKIKETYSKIAKFFDIGFQDKGSKNLNILGEDSEFSILDPSTYGIAVKDSLLSKVPKPYKSIEGDKQVHISNVFGKLEENQDVYVLTKKNKRFKDLLMADVNIFDYFEQFFVGRENIQDANSDAMFVYSLMDRLNQTLSGVGLGLSLDNSKSGYDILKNLVLKRFLPVYGGYQAYQYINYLTEDKEGNNIQKDVARTVKATDIGYHKIKDTLGITSAAKKLTDLMPGSDFITELPIINSLALDKTAEEREEYYETGVNPIRKGRYWSLGNTPFTGSKINYYKPNLYRRINADVEFSDSKYGSRQEYFDNAWFSSPIKHFITDKYHYENKHYYDRPYLLTSPQFENVPIIGDFLSGTIGKIIKPQKKMHLEYWGEHSTTEDGEEITTTQVKAKPNIVGSKVIEGASNINNQVSISKDVQGQINQNYNTSERFKTINPFVDKDLSIYNPNLEEEISKYQVYTTSSGKPKIVSIDGDKLKNINYELKKHSIKKVEGADDTVRINTPHTPEEEMYDIEYANGLKHTIANQYDNAMDLVGMSGFINEAFISGSIGENMSVIDTSGYSMSFANTFWNQEIGGIGGELSEIMRRFIPKRRNDYEYINPIRNTMPSFLPGENYFTDFRTGDPYSKVTWGEGRLPGEGYERLWGIKDPMDMGIGSSFIGKSVDDIKRHFLNLDPITDEALKDIVDSGTEIHEKIEKEFIKEGIAIDVEQKVLDEEHNIVGTYDIRLHDNTSKHGQAIMDVKSISAKGFKEIKKNKQAKEEHQKQVNFYLHQLGLDKGYVMYVNRDNTDERFTLQFNYDKKLYEESVGNVEVARNEIREAINNRELSKADLYDNIDKFRILADVAPYSDEYSEMKKMLSMTDLKESEKKEFDEIVDRVKNQKEPLRVYDYKFKTANLEKETYVIDKVLDKNRFTVKGLEGQSFRLAGVSVPDKETENEQQELEEYLAKNLKSGQKVVLGLDADENNRKPSGTYNSVDAVVYVNGKNINKELIDTGLGKAKENDNSATGIHARYSQGEIRFGSAWERIAHLDTYFNTKWLQVRSPYEMYKINEVYGEDFAEWERPVEDFLIPAIRRNIESPLGLVVGTFVGTLFGKRAYSKAIGGAIGFSTVALGKTLVGAKETITGEKWIPKDRIKQNEMEEYVDKLKYVKNIRLYEKYKRKALVEDGFDVEEYINSNKEKGEVRKGYKNTLKKSKSKYKRQEYDINDLEDDRKEAKLSKEQKKELRQEYKAEKKELKRKIDDTDRYSDRKTRKERKQNLKQQLKDLDDVYEVKEEKLKLKNINNKINELETERTVEILPENALKAIEYYNAAETTVYGYDKGEPLQNLISALPKKERDYFKHFVKAPEEERSKILEIAPEYLKDAFKSVWGMNVGEKEPLAEYFTEHQLPDLNWIGWDENINLDTVKVKMVKNEGMELNEFNIWDDNKRQADLLGEIPLPDIDYRQDMNTVKNKLYRIFKNSGYDDINIQTRYSNSNSIDIYNRNSSKEEVEEKLREYMLI